MSRHTKILIIALFLVLLAIPVVYLLLTWCPVEPLHFRIARDVRQVRTAFGEVQHVYIVEVRNTSSTTVHLHGTGLKNEVGPGVTSAPFLSGEQFTPPDFATGTGILLRQIPPHGAAYYAVARGEHATHVFHRDDLQVLYLWSSAPQSTLLTFRNRLQAYLPEPFSRYLYYAAENATTAPLDTTLLRANSPSSP